MSAGLSSTNVKIWAIFDGLYSLNVIGQPTKPNLIQHGMWPLRCPSLYHFIQYLILCRLTRMNSCLDCLLSWLAMLDCLFILSTLLDYCIIKVWNIDFNLYYYLFPYVLYPGKVIIMNWITFLITGCVTERYLAICR